MSATEPIQLPAAARKRQRAMGQADSPIGPCAASPRADTTSPFERATAESAPETPGGRSSGQDAAAASPPRPSPLRWRGPRPPRAMRDQRRDAAPDPRGRRSRDGLRASRRARARPTIRSEKARSRARCTAVKTWRHGQRRIGGDQDSHESAVETKAAPNSGKSSPAIRRPDVARFGD